MNCVLIFTPIQMMDYLSAIQKLAVQLRKRNHRNEELTVGKEPEWKVDKQPAWLVAAIRRTIADLPHGYEEAAEILAVALGHSLHIATPFTVMVHTIGMDIGIIIRIEIQRIMPTVNGAIVRIVFQVLIVIAYINGILLV